MRCLHIIHRYAPARGGSEKFMIEMSERLVRDGHEVTVYTTDALDIQHFWLRGKSHIETLREKMNGVEVKRFKVRRFPKHPQVLRILGKIPGFAPRSLFSFPSPLVPKMLASISGDETFDIVHAAAFPYDSMLYTGYRISKKQGIPFVASPFLHLGEEENDEVRRFYTRFHQMRLLRMADMVFVQTEIEKNFLLKAGVPEKRMHLLGMGINPSELEGGQGERFREKYELIGPIVCYIGPKTYDKGTFDLIKAMELLWKGGDPATVVMVGTDIEDFRRYVSQLPEKIRSKCLMLDYISDEEKADLLDACDVLVLPSRTDSFGIVFLEAWFYGKPVIGAKAGGIPGVINDGVDGILVSFGDHRGLALAIHKILTDHELAARLGEAGRKKVLSEFTWDKKYASLLATYERLTEDSRR
ncbi:MAG: glycosyltransferase family 4 protein [Actinomycetota bacterium]|nr:glycosyltransferase family 4 protein [Actinomycetota bacterium]